MAEQSRRFPILIQMIQLQFLLYTFDAAASSPSLNFGFGISPAVGVNLFDDTLGLFKGAIPEFRIFPKIRNSTNDINKSLRASAGQSPVVRGGIASSLTLLAMTGGGTCDGGSDVIFP